MAVWAVGGPAFIWQGAVVLRSSWEIRMLEDRIELRQNGRSWSRYYRDVSEARLEQTSAWTQGPAHLRLLFRDGRDLVIPVDPAFRVVEIVQTRTSMSVRGMKPERLTIEADNA